MKRTEYGQTGRSVGDWKGGNRKIHAALLLALVHSGMAQAQSGAAQEPLLEEILVTAQKRVERLQDVPISISALNEQMLLDMGADSFIDYARAIPGLSFASRGPSRSQIIVRGVSPLTGVSTVGVYLDGVESSFSFNNPDFRLFDVERVEVLRGPQGTLYGAGSMGGTIKVITNKPNPDLLEFRADGTLASIRDGGDIQQISAMANIPLVAERAALRLSASYREDDGWIDNPLLGTTDVNSSRIRVMRVAGRALATERLTLEAIVNYQESDLGQLNVRTVGDPAAFGLAQPSFERHQVVRTVAETEADRNLQYTLLATYDTPWGVFESVTGFNDLDDLRVQDSAFLIGVPGFSVTFDNDIQIFNQELRFVSELDGIFDFAGGVFYRERDRDADLLVVNGGALFGAPGLDFINSLTERNTEIAVFGEVYLRPVDRLEITVGLRAFREKIENTGRQALDEIVLQDTGDDSTFESITPKFAVSYDLAEDLLLYVMAAKGVRSGGINGQFAADPAFVPAYDDDSVWSYEAGLKSQFLDRRVTINSSLFYTDWKNMQILGLPDNPALGFTTNAGAARTRGAELEARFIPLDGLTLSLAAGYTEATLKEPAQGAPAGAKLPNVPKTAYSAAAQYSFPVTSTIQGFARADWQYKGETNSSILELPTQVVPSYNLVNARVGIEMERWSAYLFVENVTDTLAMSWNVNSGQYYARPRTFGLNVRTNF